MPNFFKWFKKQSDKPVDTCNAGGYPLVPHENGYIQDCPDNCKPNSDMQLSDEIKAIYPEKEIQDMILNVWKTGKTGVWNRPPE